MLIPSSLDKEQAIIQRAGELMLHLGIKSLTMDDVAQQLGISKKTLYQVVENKADLVYKIISGKIEQQRLELSAVIEESSNVIDELLKIYRYNSQVFSRLNPSITFELNKYYPESWLLLENFRNDFIFSCVTKNLENGVMSGFYRDDINIAIIAKLYTIRSLEILNTGLFPPKEFPTTMVLREMFIYHIRGIASKKGHDYLEQLDFNV